MLLVGTMLVHNIFTEKNILYLISTSFLSLNFFFGNKSKE